MRLLLNLKLIWRFEMKDLTLQLAINEAKRFISRAEDLKEARKEKNSYVYQGKTEYYNKPAGRQSGAVRRASMDLTRVLADLRLGR
jgi:hypothetical protein